MILPTQSLKSTVLGYCILLTASASLALAGPGFGQSTNPATPGPTQKTFIDYFQPTPITSSLSATSGGPLLFARATRRTASKTTP